MRSWLKLLRIFLVLAFVMAAACTSGDDDGGGGSQPGAEAYPRSETLYTSGTQWGPPHNWNPLVNWDYASGTVGLVYETLFLYDPLADEFTPWLAESGEWTSDTVYELTLRDGITWTDGERFTAEDVVFTVELGQMPSVPYSTLWTWLESAEAVDDLHVRFTFSQANYQEWANWIFNNPIVPEHLWEGMTEEEVTAGANENPVGTGPYLYETHDQDRQVWLRNDDWWGIEQLGIEMGPRYVVDVVNPSNSVALGRVLQGGVDLSNNFLPGVATLVDGGYGITTFYPEAPYMLSANTAWMVPNLTRAPMNDPAFRKALAFSVDTGRIVEDVFGNMVMAANPTGLLPIWDKYVDESVVDDLGFGYDPDAARQMLADAGYRDTDGDGFVENLDGSAMNLSLIVPNGWTDWMESIRVISESSAEVGIRITPEFPDYNALVDARNTANFDLVINNDRQISNTPWTYYDYLFRLPILDTQTTVNFARYENEQAWQLTQQLDQTPVEDVAAMQAITSQLQSIFLTDLPVIPLWYNALWFQANTSVWANWPADGGSNEFLPASWRGYYQMTGILALAELEPAPSEG
jgi:peptide/nickel transport system substrate-binding protein